MNGIDLMIVGVILIIVGAIAVAFGIHECTPSIESADVPQEEPPTHTSGLQVSKLIENYRQDEQLVEMIRADERARDGFLRLVVGLPGEYKESQWLQNYDRYVIEIHEWEKKLKTDYGVWKLDQARKDHPRFKEHVELPSAQEYMRPSMIYLRKGPGEDQVRKITKHSITDNKIYVDRPWKVLPGTATEFSIFDGPFPWDTENWVITHATPDYIQYAVLAHK